MEVCWKEGVCEKDKARKEKGKEKKNTLDICLGYFNLDT